MTEAELFTVVETTQGRVRGLRTSGIHAFKGLRYGADTSGRNRFMPPHPVLPWAGVRDATGYGQYAPQMPSSRLHAYADLILYDQQPGGMGEDCLVLNVWTPSVSGLARKPVLVQLHGGGFYAGSGNSPQFDGEMLARFGDAVVVTVNHRLGAFGFLNLAELGGERYASSGAVGMLDVVAALRWVRENIAAFGGDPRRVLVFGQSGGGAKTSVLMAMPSARGLFHRAGVMSGSTLRVMPEAAAARTAEAFLDHLGVERGGLQRVHELPFHQLLAAQVALEMSDRRLGEAPRVFAPVVDGAAIPRHPFDPEAPAESADVPLLVGTTLDERAYRMADFEVDEAGLLAWAAKRVGPDAPDVVAMYRDEDPKATPFLLKARIDTDMTFRRAAHAQADRKAAAGPASVFSYLWSIPSPAWGGRYGACHGVDIGPSLHDIRHGLNGPAAEQVRLADQLASAWVAFAATGDPSNPHLPAWAPYTTASRTTMVFERSSACTALHPDPRGRFRAFWAGRPVA